MGELAIQSFNKPVDQLRPRVLPGQLLLGRETNIRIDSSDFAGNQTLMNLSNSTITRTVNRTEIIVRRTTELSDVVRAVLRVSHFDLNVVQKANLGHLTEEVLGTFDSSGITLADPDIVVAIEEKLPKIAKTDLMRGMDAFREAEFDQHQGTYESTIIKPAILLAGWMILTESQIDLV